MERIRLLRPVRQFANEGHHLRDGVHQRRHCRLWHVRQPELLGRGGRIRHSGELELRTERELPDFAGLRGDVQLLLSFVVSSPPLLLGPPLVRLGATHCGSGAFIFLI